jgi:septum formation protein
MPITPTIGNSGWSMHSLVYLASQSPRRRQLLDQLGIACELLLPGPDEDAEALEQVLPRELPLRYVQRVTQLKLDAALLRQKRRGLPDAPVLCADTTVALGRTIFGKPFDQQDAARMLQDLSGNTHTVLTGVVVGTDWQRLALVSRSRVSLAPMSAAQIENYVASGEPIGKAGAYAVQGRAAAYISKISGSYSGIMGLPLFETAQLLRSFGFNV